jgi:hypothetical protein
MRITTRTLVVTLSLALALLALACGGAEHDSAAPAADSETTAPASGETGAVAYEPAYPDDVSTEELSAEDTAQQQTHRHGGEEHTHDGASENDHGHGH